MKEKWIGGDGVGLTWTDAFSTATLNSIASGNAILSDINIANGTALDMFIDVSIHLASAAFVAPNQIGIYIYPKNHSGVYGDGRFSSSAAGPPAGNYLAGFISIVAATQAQDGVLPGILIAPGDSKLVMYNQGGIAFASSGNTCQYRSYDRSIS